MINNEVKDQIVKDILNENIIVRKGQCYFLQTSSNIKQYSFNELNNMMIEVKALMLLGLPYKVYCGALIDNG